MALENIIRVTGTAVVVPGDDIDTDRIIPARFMKCITFDGLGEYLFYDVRKDAEGHDTDHNLNNPAYSAATIIISGSNFGCGSSREHAPQAITKAGFRAVIAEGFAEIFFGNSIQLGMPCLTVSHEDRLALEAAVTADPQLELILDLKEKLISAGDAQFPFTLPETSRQALMSGSWDPLQELLDNSAAVDKLAAGLIYID
jgi:3-isopropylmalate/(R)-2-methylmalate dehydratase small subunit